MAKAASSTKAGKVYRSPQQDSSATDLLSDRPTYAQIAQEAYAIHLANGAPHGRDLDDWLEAERRLQARTDTHSATQQQTPAFAGGDALHATT
jgi:hypothetical protein